MFLLKIQTTFFIEETLSQNGILPNSFVQNHGLPTKSIYTRIEFLACLSHAADVKYRREDACHEEQVT